MALSYDIENPGHIVFSVADNVDVHVEQTCYGIYYIQSHMFASTFKDCQAYLRYSFYTLFFAMLQS